MGILGRGTKGTEGQQAVRWAGAYEARGWREAGAPDCYGRPRGSPIPSLLETFQVTGGLK